MVEDEEGNKYQGVAKAPETKPMESELRGYLHLRSAFRGDMADVLTALEHTHDECIKIVLPTSRLNMLHLAVASGHAGLVKHLCDQFPNTVDNAANNGLTPLMIACLFGLYEIAQILIDKSANVNAICASIPYARVCWRCVGQFSEAIFQTEYNRLRPEHRFAPLSNIGQRPFSKDRTHSAK